MQVILRIVLFHFQYTGIGLFGGDSGTYYWIAQGHPGLNTIWPLGWPYLLRFFLWIAPDYHGLVILQAIFAMAAQGLFIATLVRWARFAPLGAAVFSSPFFFNPYWIRLNSFVLMADTVTVFLLAVSAYLLLQSLTRGSTRKSGGSFPLFAHAFLLGAMTLFKLVLRTWSIPTSIVVGVGVWKRGRRLVLPLLMVFLLAPSFYSVLISYPVYKTVDHDHFSGYSILANLLPHSTCQILVDSTSGIENKAKVSEICEPSGLTRPAWEQLANPDLFIGRVEAKLWGEGHPIEANRFLRGIAVLVILAHPEVAFSALISNLSMYLSMSPPVALSYVREPQIHHCEGPIMDFFKLTPTEYLENSNNFVREHFQTLQLMDRLGSLTTVGYRWIYTLWILMVPYFIVHYRKFPRSTVLCLLGLALAGSTLLGGHFEPRVFFAVDYVLLLAMGIGLAEGGALDRLGCFLKRRN